MLIYYYSVKKRGENLSYRLRENMARNPFRAVKELLKGLAGGYDEELDDDKGYNPEDLAELNRQSAKGLSDLVERNGIQTMTVDDDEEEKDRLGIKKPKIQPRTGSQSKSKTSEKQQIIQSSERDEH